MKRDNRQILVNPHSSVEKIPAGALNLGEIGVQHNNVEDAALYVETVADSESASTVAKFITEKAIDSKIENALDIVEMQIESLNDEIGLPHDPEAWNSGLSVWQAIEQTYEEMTAGTAAASTKLFIDETEGHDEKYLKLRSVVDQASSAVNYYIKSEGISEAIESAYTIVNDKVESLSGVVKEFSAATVEKLNELSAATDDLLDALDFEGVPQEGKPIVNVTQENGLVNAEAGNISAEFVEINESGDTLDEALEYILENIEANKVDSEDKTVVVVAGDEGTDLSVNIDGATLVKDANGVISADLKLLKETENLEANVREQYKLVYGDSTTAIGDIVKIYKDSSLHHAELGTMGDELASEDDPTIIRGTGDTALDLVYHKEDGTYELVKIDVNDFLEESEFKDGLVVDDHIVKVKVDENSEEVVIDDSGNTAPVLSVSEDGVKISNIQRAIDTAVEDLVGSIDADVTGASEDGHVTVEVVQENTELTRVVVSTDDIASQKELDKVEESIGLNEDGSFSADPTSNFASAATSVREEIKLIDEALKEVSDKLDAASVEKGEDGVENFVSLSVTDDGEGATAITINDAELKQAIDFIHDDISTEIAAREEAIDKLIGTSASTSAETSIWGVKNYVEEIVNDLDADAVQEVEFAAVAEKDETAYGSNAGATVVPMGEGEVGKKLVLDLSLLKLDCGEY